MRNRFRVVLVSLGTVVTLVSVVVGCTLTSPATAPVSEGPGLVKEAWGIILRDYVERSGLDTTALERAALKGIVKALNDPHTAYLEPDEYKLSISQQQGSFGGIGATVGVRDGQIVVVAPIPGTPAAAAGIKAGDAILAVNGESTQGMAIQDVVLRIRGPAGTSVRVTILPQGETKPVELEIVRAQINVPSVSSEMRGTIAYIRIYFFSERTDTELAPVIQRLKRDGATGIIIDVRSNPGGPVDIVVDVTSHFVRSGVVLYIVDNEGREVSYPVKRSSITTDLPLVVLTDNFSASGSEVFAGAIQDHGRGVVAGARTFGKGSANKWYELSDGSALYLTTSRWLTPNRRLIEGRGIAPDYELDLSGDALLDWALDFLARR